MGDDAVGVRSGVLAIVVAYGADADLAACLSTYRGEVIVVDNASSAATAGIARDAGARYVDARANLGFAAGVNLGLRTAWDKSADVLLLNPDARTTAADVSALHSFLRSADRRAAAGPLLVGTDGVPQRASWPLPSPGQVWCEALGLARFWHGPTFVTGAVLLLRAEAVAEVGDLDERYFLYAEEADWQRRALDAGWTVDVADNLTVAHVGAGTSTDEPLRERLFHAANETYARRWFGTLGWQVMRVGWIVATLRRCLLSSGERRASARRVVMLYARGPRRALPPWAAR